MERQRNVQTQDPTSLNNPSFQPSIPEIHVFRDADGKVPFWDDPSVHGGIDRPQNYQPRTDMMQVMADFYHGRTKPEDDLLLTLLRDSICINENQLRRLLQTKLSSNVISKRLRYMATFGLTDKWKVQSRFDESQHVTTPWSVGIAGYLYLKHMYPDFTLHPTKMIEQGVKGIQRYVAVNEIRTQLYEFQALRGWRWHGVIDNNPRLGKPLAVGKMQGPKGEFLLVVERLQQSQAYMQHIRTKLHNWNEVFKQNKCLPVMDFPRTAGVVLLSVATDEMAHHVASKLVFDTPQHLPIWFITDERLEKQRLNQAILVLKDNTLYPYQLSFLKLRSFD
jgi:hypothetical protein